MVKNSVKYFFVSDVHLGLTTHRTKEEGEKLFLQWLDMVEAELSPNTSTKGAIFMLGDIFDFWFEYRRVIPTSHTTVLARLRELTTKGVDIWFLPGNHDAWSRGFLEREIGLKFVKEGDLAIELEGTHFYLTHGDKALAKYRFIPSLLYKLFHSKTAYNIFSALVHPDITMWFGNRWSTHSRKSKFVVHNFTGDDEPVVRYAKEVGTKNQNKFSYYIMGHLHSALIHPISENEKLAVLGQWIVGDPIYAVFDGEKCELHKFEVTL